jgi:esterase/lipase
VLIGAKDRIIPVSTARRVLRTLPPGAARVAFYLEGWHLLLRDLDRAVVAEDIRAWLAAPTGPA